MDDPRIERLQDELDELKQSSKSKEKDGWEKAGIISQFVSGTVITIVGIMAGILLHTEDLTQKRAEVEINADQGEEQRTLSKYQSREQLRLSTKQFDAQMKLQQEGKKVQESLQRDRLRDEKSKELDSLAGRPGDQARLLTEMESDLPPRAAVSIASKYIHPPHEQESGDATYAGEALLFNHALGVLQHVKQDKDAHAELERIGSSGEMPDSEIAKAILEKPTSIYIRASEIDDFGDFTLNGKVIPGLVEMTFGQETDWTKIGTDVLKSLRSNGSKATLKFVLRNGPAGGYGGRLQISEGLRQYDTGSIQKNECPCDKPAFQIRACFGRLTDKQGKSGHISLQGVSFEKCDAVLSTRTECKPIGGLVKPACPEWE